MEFIFWQNILSIHQATFIRNLAENNSVILVVEREMDDKRKKIGWSVPDFGNAKIMVRPNQVQVEDLFDDPSIIHVFTGISAFPMVYKAFKFACKSSARIWVQLEPYNWLDGKGFLRELKYRLLALKYNNKIDGILAIGSKANKCYSKVGFNITKIFDWAYFLATPSDTESKSRRIEDNGLPSLIYVGSLDENKNLLSFLPIIKRHREMFNKFSVYGDGSLMMEMKQFEDDKIHFHGNIPNSEIFERIRECDILILPSLYDGWGAVINEALMVGTRVLCSESCGASDLVKEDRGEVFYFENDDFENKLTKLLLRKKINSVDRKNIISWSENTISGDIAVQYFMNIMDYKYKRDEIMPVAPWKI